SFLVTVNPVNDAPTLDALNAVTVNEDAPTQTVNLTGIGAGDTEAQALLISAVSSNTAVVPNPTVTYPGSGSFAHLTHLPAPAADAGGTATLSVTVNDGGAVNNTVTRTFAATVNAVFVDALGRLIVNGTGGDDTITVSERPGDFQVQRNSDPVLTFTKGQVTN